MNTNNEDRYDLLRKSTMSGDYDLTKFYLEHSDIDLTNDHSFIESAAYYGYYNIVELLLEHNANPNGFGGLIGVTKSKGHDNINKLLKIYERNNILKKIKSKID